MSYCHTETRTLDLTEWREKQHTFEFQIADVKIRCVWKPEKPEEESEKQSLLMISMTSPSRSDAVTIKFKSYSQSTGTFITKSYERYPGTHYSEFSFSVPFDDHHLAKTGNLIEMTVQLPFATFCIHLKWKPTFLGDQLFELYKIGKDFGDVTLIPIPKGQLDDDIDASIEGVCDQKQNDEIKLSSCLLMSASKVFKQMLMNPMKEQKEKIIRIDTESVQVIDDMVFYITTGILRENADPLSLLKLSHLYQLGPLSCCCLNRLANNVYTDNFMETKAAFDRYSPDDLVAIKYYKKLAMKYHKNRKKYKALEDEGVIPKDWQAWSACM